MSELRLLFICIIIGLGVLTITTDMVPNFVDFVSGIFKDIKKRKSS